jgi:hypothetical protein
MQNPSRKTLGKAPAAVIFILVMASIVSAAGQYGPVGIPKTLLTLYQESDVIAVARFAKTERGGVIRQDPDHTVIGTRRYFDISYVIKGEHSKFLVLADEEFVSSDTAATAMLEQTIDDDYHIATGDTVLLFLRKSEDGKSLELVNDDDSIKKLSARDLSVYESRIAELRSIYDDTQPDPAWVLDWLVRCTEDPATRWEGAFELIVSLERAEWQQKQASKDQANRVVLSPTFDRAIFAKLLTDTHKRMLGDVLFARTADDMRRPVRGDNELIELVAKWGDARLAGYLLDEIGRDPKPSYAFTLRIRTLVKLLDDKKASELAAKIDESIAMTEPEANDSVAKENALTRFVTYARNKLVQPDK